MIDVANARGVKDIITAVVVTIGVNGQEDQLRAQKLERKRQILGQMPLFRPLDERELRRVLQVTEVRGYSDGDSIINQGEAGDSLYIVLNGKVGVYRNDTQVKELSVGEHFGEMALIRSQPRSASVRSLGASELLTLRRTEFFEIIRNQPRLAVKLLWQFTGVLAERLAETTRDLGVARNGLTDETAQQDITEELFMLDEEDAHERKTVEVAEGFDLDNPPK